MTMRNPIRNAQGSRRGRRILPVIAFLLLATPVAIAGASLHVSGSSSEAKVTTKTAVSRHGVPRHAVDLHRAGLRVSGPWGSLSVESVDAGHARWARSAHIARRRTSFGLESIRLGATESEEFLTVHRRQGVRTWRWRLVSNLTPKLAHDSGVRFAVGARVTGPRIDPVEILDVRGRSVTPRGLHWRLAHKGRTWFLTLRLDDRRLPTPYVIDPSITFRTNGTSTAGGNGTSVSVARPTGAAANDLLFASLVISGGTTVGFATTPAGWTQVRRTDNGTSVALATFVHTVSASGDAGPYVWTLSGGTARRFSASITTYTGVDKTAPIVQSTGGTGTGATVTATGVTGTAGDWGAVALGTRTKTTYAAAGYGERYDANSGGNNADAVTGEGGDFAMAGGATGNKSAVGGLSGAWAAQLAELKLDTVAPTNSVSVAETGTNPDSFVSGKTFFYRPSSATGGSFTVTAAAADAQSGIRSVTFPGLAGGFTPTTSVDSPFPGPYTRTYTWPSGGTAADNGAKSVAAVDNGANSTADSFTLTADPSAPATTDNTAAIGSAWTTASQTVTLTPSDVGSGVASTYYTTDNSTPTTGSPQGTSIALSADGVYTIKYFSRDNVANQEAVKTGAAQIRIDKAAPSSATLDPLPAAIMNGKQLSGSAADATSGVASVSYLYCAGSACTPSTVIGSSSSGPNYSLAWNSQPADGVYSVRARATDAAGNTRDSAIQTVQIDNEAPAAPALSFGNFIDTSATGSTVYYGPGTGGNFTVTATASDPAGIDHVSFPVMVAPGWSGGGAVSTAPYQATYQYTNLATTSPGVQGVTVTNGVGETSAASTYTVVADSEPPSSSIVCDGTACAGTWYRSGVAVALVATDLASGVDHIRYTTDGTDPDRINGTTYTQPILLDSTTTLKYRAYDNVNNAEPVQTRVIQVDLTPPSTTATCNADTCGSGWYAPGLHVELAASDTESGVARIRYTTDGSDPDLGNGSTYTGPISLSSPTTLRFRAYDDVGNAEPAASLPLQVDATGPSAALSAPAPNETVRSGATLTADASDADSGLSHVDFRYCPGTSCTWASGQPIGSATGAPYSVEWDNQPKDGKYTLLARATDDVGNTSDSAPVTVTIDNVADTNGDPGGNPIQAENQQAGTTAWQLGIPPYQVGSDSVSQIKGYASATSVNKGDSIGFKVSVNPAQSYTIDIYRLGCYPDANGTCLGGRFMRHLGPYDGVHQLDCTVDGPSGGNTGLTECHWTGPPSLTIPSDWTSGIYIAQLTNAQNFQNDIVFVVRDDASHSAILYQQPVNTYQAYNNYPDFGGMDTRNGKSLYDNSSGGADTVAGAGRPRAVKVSFDRPYADSGFGDLLDPNGWSWEQYFIHWAEKQGYDLTYSSSLDTQVRPALMLNHMAWISVGHDEYWSSQMYDAAEAARDAGVNLGFLGGNDVYWQVRYEASGGGVPNRTMVGYKNTPNNTYSTVDPVAATNPAQATVRFQDPPVNRPGQLLTGLTFAGGTGRSNKNTPYNVLNADNWLYDGTGLGEGASVPGINGYESDGFSCLFPLPANDSYALLSSNSLQDELGYWVPTNSSLYQAPSGAWVFDAGTMSWSWALDRPTPAPDQGLPTGWVNPGVQKATKNLLDVFIGAKAAPAMASHLPDCTTHRVLSFESGQLLSGPPPATQDASDRVLGTVSLETANPIKGAYSERIPNVGNSYLDKRFQGATDVSTSFYMRLNAMPTTDARIALLSGQLQNQGNLLIRPNGTLCVRNNNAWIGGTPANSCTTAPLTVGTTYRIKLRQTVGTGGDGVLEGYLATGDAPFGAPFVRSPTQDVALGADKLSIGTTTITVLDAVFDDITIDGSLVDKPAAPTALTASAPTSSTEADLNWTDNASNESSYVVERSSDSSFANVTSFKLPAGTTSYADTNVATSTTYWYRVKAINVGGSSDYSGVVSVTTRPAPPAAPTNLTATILSPSATKLDWTDNSTTETNFVIERSPDALFASPTLITLPADTTSYTDAGLPDGPYYYRVRAINPGTTGSGPSNVVRGPRIKDVTFEDGTPSLVNPTTGVDRNAGNLVVQETATPIKGLYSARVPNLANVYLEQNVSNIDDLYASFYLRLNALPSADNRIVQVLSGTTTVANLWIRTTGQVCLKYFNFWSGGAIGPGCTLASAPLLVGNTYRIAVHQRRGNGTTNAYVEAYLANGDAPFTTPFTSQSVPPSAGASGGYWTTPATQFRIGATLNALSMNMVFDDIKLDSMFLPGASP
jgi:Fn3 associated/Chitobiase/beta-hexosaminidase C-terminal domain